MYSTTDFRKGLKIEVDDIPFEIVDFQHFKPGKGGAMIRTKLRNILNGRIQDITFRSGEKVGQPDLETREMQFLYREGEELIFMDQTSYEQLHVKAGSLGGKDGYLKDSQMVEVLLYRGEPLDFDLPAALVFEVVKTEPGVKGDTVSNVLKPATVETGLVVQVPIFVNIGDKIKVDTRTGSYIGRESQ
jgi:elongation factor P